MNKSHPFFLIVGPTASGKSNLALKLAQKFDGAILNCDSLQVYQRMDIGTAKPSKEERAIVPHLLFDILPPGATLTAGDFRKLALEELAKHLPERPVFGVGGSGFYIQALEKGMFQVPKANPQIDADVREELRQKGQAALYEELKRLDPEYAEELSPNDSYRIVRGLVILRETGKKVSDLRRDFRPEPFPYPKLKMGLNTEREQLLPKIEARVQQMMKDGFLNEVKGLMDDGFGAWPAMQSVGYRECMMHLRGEVALERLIPFIVEKTSQLSKKQRTWFRREPDTHWLSEPPFEPAAALVSSTLDQLGFKA